MYTCILYTAVVMYMCTAGLIAAAHVYTLYALYYYSQGSVSNVRLLLEDLC